MAARRSSSFFSSSRKGFELAIGTIVVMILGIVIVAGGILLLANITDGSTRTIDQVTADQHTALRRLLGEGQLVATYPGSQVIPAGKTSTYALAITNRLDGDRTFRIEFPGLDPRIRIVPVADQKLKENQQQELIIAVTPGKNIPPGQYPVIVNVSESGVTYDSVRFFEIRIK